jgi:type I restriction enzyme M protein
MEIKELQPIVNFIYSVANDELVNRYEKAKYKDIILPMTVVRRLDVVLEPTKKIVLDIYNQYKDQLDDMDDLLGGKNGSKLGFHNHSNFTLKSLLDDPSNIKSNFENYLNGFSADIQDILEKFEFRNQVAKMERTNILYAVIQKFCSSHINLSPNDIKDLDNNLIHLGLSNLGMGYVFEELLRRFNEDENAQAGKHFTPREIISLMTNLVFVPLKDEIKQGTYFIYDNACGSGGILSEAKQFITDSDGAIQSEATIKTYGQEASDEIFAICKSDMMIRGENPDNIKYGSTLSEDQLGDMTFDFMLTNPPFGTPWKVDQVELGIEGTGQEKKLNSCTDDRFDIGITDVGDGQMMFMQNMLSKMKKVSKETPLGSHIASIHNGSSLFSGDAGSGESNIRKYIIENDMLEAIIELPKDMFYNTNISTYIWLVTNNKKQKGQIKLISASSKEFYKPMTKSLGKKRHEMTPSQITKLTEIFMSDEQNKYVKVFDNEDFGYSKVTIDRPLRLEYKDVSLKIEEFKESKEFKKLKDDKPKELLKALENSNDTLDDTEFFTKLKKQLSFKPIKGQVKVIRDIFAKVNKNASEVLNDPYDESKGLMADSDLRDSEKIPLKKDIQEYFDEEVKPYVSDAWIVWDSVKIGYEILFNKYFYEYKAPRKLDDIYKDIKALELKTENLLEEIVS